MKLSFRRSFLLFSFISLFAFTSQAESESYIVQNISPSDDISLSSSANPGQALDISAPSSQTAFTGSSESSAASESESSSYLTPADAIKGSSSGSSLSSSTLTPADAIKGSSSGGSSDSSYTLPIIPTDVETMRYYLITPAEADMAADEVLSLVPLASYYIYNEAGTLIDQAATSVRYTYAHAPEGFRSLKLEHSNVGRWYYRTYTKENGWSDWATSKETLPDKGLVSAVQVRTKGYTHNLGEVYLRAVLNDGTLTDWAPEGQAVGVIGDDRYIIALRIALWNRNTEFTESTKKPLANTYTEGVIKTSEGIRYQTAEGTPYTGFGFDDDQNQYYFIDSVPVTGWQSIDGYNLYFDESGRLLKSLEGILKKPSSYEIRINKSTRTMYIMAPDSDGNFTIPYKTFMVTVGEDTPIGSFKTIEKLRWHFMHEDCYCQYLTRFYGHFLLHSLLYTKADNHTMDAIYYNYMDDSMSGGCIRLRAVDCAWIHDNIPLKTPVVIYEDQWNKGPVEKDAIQQAIPRDQDYDPTDPLITGNADSEEAKKAIAEAKTEAASGKTED